MAREDSKKKLKKEVVAVIAVALVIIAVATAFIVKYVNDSKKEEEAIDMVTKQWDAKLKSNAEQAGEIRGQINHDVVGTYYSMGDAISENPAEVYAYMQLMPDGSVSAQNMNGESVKGWWTSQKNGEVDFVAVGFSGSNSPYMYQIYNSYLIDLRSVYYGHMEKSSRFATTLTSGSDKGEMKIELKTDGKASAEFIDTNEESENYGLKYMFSGKYNVDGDFMSITLNTAETRFVMFDYGVEGTDADSGIASVYYQKQN